VSLLYKNKKNEKKIGGGKYQVGYPIKGEGFNMVTPAIEKEEALKRLKKLSSLLDK
jgi:hypothetical protein